MYDVIIDNLFKYYTVNISDDIPCCTKSYVPREIEYE